MLIAHTKSSLCVCTACVIDDAAVSMFLSGRHMVGVDAAVQSECVTFSVFYNEELQPTDVFIIDYVPLIFFTKI